MLPTLRTQIERADIRVRQNIVWALSRLVADPEVAVQATDALRLALDDRVADVRQAACYALSLSRTEVDPDWLIPRLQDESAAVRRQAITTLGQVGDHRAIASLVKNLQRSSIDRSEEHATVYALIELEDVTAIREAMAGLKLAPKAQRSLLTAIDQIDTSQLEFEEVLAAIPSDSEEAREFAARVFGRHPEWSGEVARVLASQDELPVEVLTDRYLTDESVARLVGTWLGSDKGRHRELAQKLIAQRGRISPHATWIPPLRKQLESNDEAELRSALAAAAAVSGDGLRPQLQKIASDQQRSLSMRIDALAALTTDNNRLGEETFHQLVDILQNSGSPTAADRAAQVIAASSLTTKQLHQVLPLIEEASVSQLRSFLRLFGRRVDEPLANGFLSAMEATDAWKSLNEPELSDVIKRFPPATLQRGNRMLDELKFAAQEKVKKLQQIRDQVAKGDVERGRAIFHSEKAKCSTCHRVGESGKAVGPDLTKIGRNRSVSDLIESIVFPSASIVRDYQTYQVLTVDGRAFTGMISRETVDAMEIQIASGEIVRIQRSDIDQIQSSPTSIMPSGLDDAITQAELVDVVAYLRSL